MRVQWKRLCGLGIMFWVGMSAYDYYHGSILVPGEFELNSLAVELLDQSKMLPSEIESEDESPGWSYYTYLMTGLSCITLFVVTYFGSQYYLKRVSYSKEIVATNDAIRAALFDGGCPNLDPDCDNMLIIQDNKYDVCSAGRFRGKEENTLISSCSKEVQLLNKKIEGLNEEKRNLTRFLAQSEKDNRIIKQKMMEVLREKNTLLKKLEAATREIRNNTVARQSTLDKLEESIQCSNQLKRQVQQISGEKTDLLHRLRQLEAQYKSLRRQQDNKCANTKTGSNGIRVPSYSRSVDSTKDIEQIEMKLHDLEVSLEKMKCKNVETVEFESEENDDANEIREPKILRQVSSTDMNFLSEVEPSYTNLLAKYDGDPSNGQLHPQIVESIAPAVGPFCLLRNKFVVPHTFGSALFNMLLLIPNHQPAGECIRPLVRSQDRLIVNYGIVCNYKCPYSEQLAMPGGIYFGKRTADDDGDAKRAYIWCQELSRKVQLPNPILYQ